MGVPPFLLDTWVGVDGSLVEEIPKDLFPIDELLDPLRLLFLVGNLDEFSSYGSKSPGGNHGAPFG